MTLLIEKLGPILVTLDYYIVKNILVTWCQFVFGVVSTEAFVLFVKKKKRTVHFYMLKNSLLLPLNVAWFVCQFFKGIGIFFFSIFKFFAAGMVWLYEYKIPSVLNSIPLFNRLGFTTPGVSLFNDTLAFIQTWPSSLFTASSIDSIGSGVNQTGSVGSVTGIIETAVLAHALTDNLDYDALRNSTIDDDANLGSKSIVARRTI